MVASPKPLDVLSKSNKYIILVYIVAIFILYKLMLHVHSIVQTTVFNFVSRF